MIELTSILIGIWVLIGILSWVILVLLDKDWYFFRLETLCKCIIYAPVVLFFVLFELYRFLKDFLSEKLNLHN